MFRRVMSAFAVLSVLCGPTAAQGPIVIPPEPGTAPETDRAATMARYEPWCGKPLPLGPCVDEIIRVDKILLERSKEYQRTGRGYNAGLSLSGCQSYCILRHFPHDTESECKASIATFEKMATRKPYLWRTGLRQSLLERCKLMF